jgi:Methyltransferase domain
VSVSLLHHHHHHHHHHPSTTTMTLQVRRSRGAASAGPSQQLRAWVLILFLSNAFVFQLTFHLSRDNSGTDDNSDNNSKVLEEPTLPIQQPQKPQQKRPQQAANDTKEDYTPRFSNIYDLSKPAVALPSIRIEQDVQRKQYGGAGDKVHLGGFVEFDREGVSPAVWKDMMDWVGIHSILDVGCGKGVSTSWFVEHGLETHCVEGSHDAVSQSLVPNVTTEHDFARGPWWPEKTVDAVWCVEFLEHVGRYYHHHYFPAFQKAALIFATHSYWGGWHHVEVHDDDYWQIKFASYGFIYSDYLTKRMRNLASREAKSHIQSLIGPFPLRAAHVYRSVQVYINPIVASLPEHAHLFSEDGCVKRSQPRNGNWSDWDIVRKECGTWKNGHEETKLPEHFKPLPRKKFMDRNWEAKVRKHLEDIKAITPTNHTNERNETLAR